MTTKVTLLAKHSVLNQSGKRGGKVFLCNTDQPVFFERMAIHHSYISW